MDFPHMFPQVCFWLTHNNLAYLPSAMWRFSVFVLQNDLLRVISISCPLTVHHAFVIGMAKWIFENTYFKYTIRSTPVTPMCIDWAPNAVALLLANTATPHASHPCVFMWSGDGKGSREGFTVTQKETLNKTHPNCQVKVLKASTPDNNTFAFI